jgi:hypothetical protein
VLIGFLLSLELDFLCVCVFFFFDDLFLGVRFFFWFLFRLLQFCFSSTLSFKSSGLQLGFLLLTVHAESLATSSFVKKIFLFFSGNNLMLGKKLLWVEQFSWVLEI